MSRLRVVLLVTNAIGRRQYRRERRRVEWRGYGQAVVAKAAECLQKTSSILFLRYSVSSGHLAARAYGLGNVFLKKSTTATLNARWNA